MIRRAIHPVALAIVAAGPARAHAADAGPGAGLTIAVPLLVVAALCGAGLLRRRGGPAGAAVARVASLGAGLALVAALLLSPLDALAARYLAAHMVQHFALMLIAAPLIVAGRPGLALLWSLPVAARRRLAGWGRSPAVRLLIHPAIAALIYFLALWLWHAPPLHQAALRDEGLHTLQHFSFLGAALLFWSAVLRPPAGERRAASFAAAFATAVHSCALAALLTTSGVIWYPAYEGGARLSALQDQQLAGLVMWVPCCAVMIGGALLIFRRLLADTELRARRAARDGAP